MAQVKALASFILMELNELQEQIKDIRKEYWWCSKAGKACFSKYGRAYFYELGRKGGARYLSKFSDLIISDQNLSALDQLCKI